MKHLLLALLLVSFSSALADTPDQIAADYRKQAAQAVSRLNLPLEKATTPLIVNLVTSGDAAGAEQLTTQLKAKLAGEPVPTPQASATLLFAQYDQARAKALEPLQKACISRIDKLLKGTSAPKLETITELGRLRAEIEGATPAAMAASAPVVTTKTSAAASNPLAELVKSLGGRSNNDGQGDDIKFPSKSTLTTSELLQITGASKRLKSFDWPGGTGLTDEGLAAFAGMKNLDTLFLWDDGRITDDGLKHLSGCSKLEVLNIGCNGEGFTGSGLEHLTSCKSLKKLNLNYLYKLEGRHLHFLTQLPSLEILLLSRCKNINDADLDVIAQMPQIKTLELGRTSITDAGLARLTGLRHLELLIVSEPLVTPEGVKVLTKGRPALEVKFIK